MKNYLLLAASILAFSCQHKNDKSVFVTNDTLVEATKIVETNTKDGDTIVLKSKDKNGLFAAEGSFDSIHTKLYLQFENDNTSKLKARIIATKGKGNIRFNQIIYPDNTADGPYGSSLSLEIKQTGIYTLVIGRSLMADNLFMGDFKVEVELTQQ